MIELIFIACLGGANSCEERSMMFTDVTPMTCMMGAQPELARWVAEHPNWRVSRWSCRYVDRSQRDI